MRLAFDPLFQSAASSSLDDIGALLTAYWTDSPFAISLPAEISIAISLAPAGPGALAIRMDPPVIPVCIDRHEALIGPLYSPPQHSVCPECLDYWLDMNFFDRRACDEVPAAATLHPLAEAITRLAALPPTDVTLTHAQVIRLADGHVSHHAVFPRRDCPRCGAVARNCVDAAPIDAAKPQKKDLPLHVHCSPWTGIVNRMELTAAPVAGSYRAMATWTSPLPVNGARGYLQRQQSSGRGRTGSRRASGLHWRSPGALQLDLSRRRAVGARDDR